MERWWESIDEARSRILSLSSILPSSPSPSISFSISSLADCDDPAHSLLNSADAYFSIASALKSPLSGSSSDPLCCWFCDTFRSPVPDLRLFYISFLPLLSDLYLTRSVTDSISSSSLAGFETIFLSLYNSQAQFQNDETHPILVPDLSIPSVYNTLLDKPNHKKGPYPALIPAEQHSKKNVCSSTSKQSRESSQTTPEPFEPKSVMKSTERDRVVGFALDYYYKEIAKIPAWSKIEFSKVVVAWAGPCCSHKTKRKGDTGEIANIIKEMRKMGIEKDNERLKFPKATKILLPWELLQPVLRILGHCLLGPLCPQDVKDAASVAVKKLYVRATHDLTPRAIMATQNLFRLDKREREKAAQNTVKEKAALQAKSSSKLKKPDILLQGTGSFIVFQVQ
ncbi:uncharacterized protein LOC110815419 [Carica papaya]|uniref:uncharacterized protein LOC110815419 n=1 Tax=Carica papaya TaxID=3649 RepID=UPI000B8CDC2E|nr:uncharacterized protein LOC110815419 [Carica papaya]